MYSKTSSSHHHVYYMLGILILLLTSCDYSILKSTIGDGGLLSGKPCPAPCFWDIHPGLTTEDEAIQNIQKHGPFAYKKSDNYVDYGPIIFDYDSSGIVQRIGFEPSTTMRVKTLIAKYGVPDAITVIYTGLTPEHPSVDAGLLFDSVHTYLGLEGQEIFPAYSLNQDTRITYITYLSESSYEDLKISSKHITKWIGYGAYKDPEYSH